MTDIKYSKDICELFTYDENSKSGLIWVRKSNPFANTVVGKEAGCIDAQGYYRVKINGRDHLCHKIIWAMFNDCENQEDKVVDHIDRDKLNNTYNNLRLTSIASNSRNQKLRITNKTGVNGLRETDAAFKSYYHNAEGKQIRKSFAKKKYGITEAREMAIAWREEMIKQVGGYSDNHGKVLAH